MFNSYYHHGYRPLYRWHDYDYLYYRPYFDYPPYWSYYDRIASINQRINNFGNMSDVWQSANINYF